MSKIPGKEFDLIIAGGGMVGSALGCLIASQSPRTRVCVLEPAPPESPAQDGNWGLRVSAISRASRAVLEHAGAWPLVAQQRISPYSRMKVWEGDDPGRSLEFSAEEVGQSELGHIIENQLLQWALLRRLEQLPNARVIAAAVEAVDTSSSRAVVIAGKHGPLGASLLVGADGVGSRTRTLMGMATRGWSYRQRAVVATIGTEKSHQDTAFQRFLPGGPLAFLPLCDGRISIVWSNTEEDAQAILKLDDEEFMKELGKASDYVLGQITGTGPRAAFPLRAQYAVGYTGLRFVLIGDAAHTVHPLAGQGVNLGLMDVAVLADAVLDTLSRGGDPGDSRCLRKYERWRKGDNLAMLAAVDGIGRVYKPVRGPLPMLRKLGVELLGRAPLAREIIIRRAMGLDGDLPRWAIRPRSAGNS
jgi:2-octaprenylphenol hydroxylase